MPLPIKELPSLERLNELFTYQPDTGNLIRKVSGRGRNNKAGAIAGCKHHGYIIVSVDCVNYNAHRLAFYLYHEFIDDSLVICHWDSTRDNNIISNLELNTSAHNMRNRPKQSNNKSGVTGVNWDKRDSKWRASIGVNGKIKHLGLFDNLFDAICKRKSTEIKLGFHPAHGR